MLCRTASRLAFGLLLLSVLPGNEGLAAEATKAAPAVQFTSKLPLAVWIRGDEANRYAEWLSKRPERILNREERLRRRSNWNAAWYRCWWWSWRTYDRGWWDGSYVAGDGGIGYGWNWHKRRGDGGWQGRFGWTGARWGPQYAESPWAWDWCCCDLPSLGGTEGTPLYGCPDMLVIGHTPSESAIEIPPNMPWGIMPRDREGIVAACEEIRAKNIPGLALFSDAKDEDLVAVKELKGLKTLIFSIFNATTDSTPQLDELTELETLGITKMFGNSACRLNLKNFKKLRHLRLNAASIDLSQLEELPHLKSLDLSQMHYCVTDATLPHLKNLKELEWLDLSGTKLTDDGLVHLRQLTRLRALSLYRVQLSGKGLSHLGALPDLESLYLFSVPLDKKRTCDADIAGIEKLTQLKRLCFLDFGVTDRGLVHLSGLTNLQRLCIGGGRMSYRGLTHLRRLTNLQMLDIAGMKPVDKGLAHLRGMKKLEVLLTSGMDTPSGPASLTGEGLKHLQALPKLRCLDLPWHDKITDAGLANVAELSELQYLGLHDVPLTDIGLYHLRNLRKLKTLDLENAYGFGPFIKGPGLIYLTNLSSLEALSLTNSPINDVGMVYISKLGNLKWLAVCGADITDQSLAVLASPWIADSLKLTPPEATYRVQQSRKESPELRGLEIVGTRVTDDGLGHLKKLKNLRYVAFGSVDRGAITKSAVEELEEKMPDLDVWHWKWMVFSEAFPNEWSWRVKLAEPKKPASPPPPPRHVPKRMAPAKESR
jgi:internalin A